MTKVCHMTSAHGAEDIRIFHKECVSLAEAGYEVFLVERGDSYIKNGVHIIGVGDIPINRVKRMTKGARSVYKKALELDCEIYHLHDPELLPYAIKLKKMGKKVVFDSHEYTRSQIETRHYLPPYITKIIKLIYSAYEDYVLTKIDGVIFPCTINGKFPYRCKNPTYLNNYPKLSEVYYKYLPDVSKMDNTVCLIGSLNYERGFKHFVQAVDKAECKALVGGKITPDSFEKEIRAMPESKNIEFLGVLNREDVVATLNKVRVGIAVLLKVGQYTTAENLSTKCYEYMSMKLPVVLTKSAFCEQMVNRYHFGICVDAENIDEYADAIRFLLDNPEAAEKMGENGRRLIKEEMNWETEQLKLLNLYERLIKT